MYKYIQLFHSNIFLKLWHLWDKIDCSVMLIRGLEVIFQHLLIVNII